MSNKVKKTTNNEQALIKQALEIPIAIAVMAAASVAKISIDFRQYNDGSLDIYEMPGEEVKGHICKDRTHCVYNHDGFHTEGDALKIAEYFINKRGGKNLSRIELVQFLIKEPHEVNEYYESV